MNTNVTDPIASGAEAVIFDVLVIGAGISGVDAAYHLQRRCPDKSFAVLEARGRIGGTWDLFRYPGIRSDSDMATLGFPFHAWRGEKSIADGADILSYIEETAKRFGIDRRVLLHHRVRRARWSSEQARWHLDIETSDGVRPFVCSFLHICSGYYDYAQGHLPELPNMAAFEGRLIHPQQWPERLDVDGKRIVVIGSGATAITLVPALAAKGAQVVMLQRSPTYIVSRPARDDLADRLRRRLPAWLADRLVRWKNIALGILMFRYARRKPEKMKQRILEGVRGQLGLGHDVERHFSPSYKPWDQRICLVPDGDLFNAIRAGQASVVTDQIDSFVAQGIRLASGEVLNADIVVTATGLSLQMMGGAKIEVDGREVSAGGRLIYKGMMLDRIPNLALAFGYTNASWTLKCDLTARYVCRLLRYMDRGGFRICTPVANTDGVSSPFLDFSSGYIRRAAAILPRQGPAAPWRLHQNYLRDLLDLSTRPVRDRVMQFRK